MPNRIRDRRILWNRQGFDPRSLSPLFALHVPWLTGFNNNDLMASVTENSANAYTGTATGTARPTYIANGQNGKPIVRFNGTSNYLNFGTILNITTGFTAFMMFRYNGAGGFYCIFSHNDGTSSGQYEIKRNSTNNSIQFASKVGGVSQFVNSNTFTVTSFNTVSAVIDPASSAAYYVNGAAAGTGNFSPTGTFNEQAAQSFLVGARNAASPGILAAMDLGSLFIYPVTLSASNRQQIEAWLKAQWATP